jgi:hypothetical protein
MPMAEDTLYFKTLSSTYNWNTNIASEGPFPSGRSGYVNLPQAYAALNRKNMRHTDNKGYPLSYVVEVEAIGDTGNAQEVEIYTAPENWVLKNAVRKWHIARNEMLARLDMLGKLGEYGRTIRPYLTVAHAKAQGDAIPRQFEAQFDTTYSGATEQTSAAVTETSLVGGEWTYTEIAATVDIEEASGMGADRYHLCLTGDHDTGVGTDDDNKRIYTHVSMMRSYLESRRNASSVIQNNQGGGSIQTEPNPLGNLMMDTPSVGELKEIVQDLQREKPPYEDFVSTDPNALNGNDALDLVSKCHLVTSTSYYKDKEVIRVPMGLMHVRTTATGGATPKLRFRLIGIDKCQG